MKLSLIIRNTESLFLIKLNFLSKQHSRKASLQNGGNVKIKSRDFKFEFVLKHKLEVPSIVFEIVSFFKFGQTAKQHNFVTK